MSEHLPPGPRERLRVTLDSGSFRDYDIDEVTLGPLGFRRGVRGWSAHDLGDEPNLYLNGTWVRQLPLFLGRPVTVSVGAPDGQPVALEVLEPAPAHLVYGPSAEPSPEDLARTPPPAPPVELVEPVVLPEELAAPEAVPVRDPESPAEITAEGFRPIPPDPDEREHRAWPGAYRAPRPERPTRPRRSWAEAGAYGSAAAQAAAAARQAEQERARLAALEAAEAARAAQAAEDAEAARAAQAAEDAQLVAEPLPVSDPVASPDPLPEPEPELGTDPVREPVPGEPLPAEPKQALAPGFVPGAALAGKFLQGVTSRMNERSIISEKAPAATPAHPSRPATMPTPIPTPKPAPKSAAAPRPAQPAARRTEEIPTPGSLQVHGVSVAAESGKRIIDNVTFTLPPATLTAVIGPSGAGKSTLLRALSGEAPPGLGRIVWDGHDLDLERDSARFRIGVVPQQDLLHPQLTVRQGLKFAAALRMPPGTNAAEREARVIDVCDQLGLAAHLDQRIGSQLSGGQRKRVSIATELLTAPDLLFLDEPTSGLDPGFDRSVMEQLHDLSREGRIVVVVTHSVLGLETCDQVVVLARGGKVAHVGEPRGVLEHFGCADYPELFDLLESDEAPAPPATPARPYPRHTLKTPGSLERPPAASALRQFATLVRRNVAVTFSDRLTLAMLVLLPLVLGGLGRVVQGEAGLSLTEAIRQGARRPQMADEAGQRLTLLLVAAILIGAAMAIRELVKERPLFHREYAVGLSPGLYLLSKSLVTGVLCFVQGLLVTWIALVGLPGADADGVRGWGRWEIALVIGLLAVASAMIGLWASAVVKTVEHTMPVLVGVVMAQLVLSSALVQVPGRPVLEQAAMVNPARWAHAANGASVNIERAHAKVADAVTDPLATYTPGQWDTDLYWLAGLALVALWLAGRALRKNLPGAPPS